MKKAVFCLAIIFSVFLFFACASAPSTPEPAAPPATAPATPAPTTPPQQTTNTPTPEAPAPGNSDIIISGAEIYTVVWGDTLTKIARKKYGNGFYYPLILMASGSVIKDQDKIIPGMKITIPRLQVNLDDSRARASMKKFFLETASITERKRPRDAAGLRNLANSL